MSFISLATNLQSRAGSRRLNSRWFCNSPINCSSNSTFKCGASAYTGTSLRMRLKKTTAKNPVPKRGKRQRKRHCASTPQIRLIVG